MLSLWQSEHTWVWRCHSAVAVPASPCSCAACCLAARLYQMAALLVGTHACRSASLCNRVDVAICAILLLWETLGVQAGSCDQGCMQVRHAQVAHQARALMQYKLASVDNIYMPHLSCSAHVVATAALVSSAPDLLRVSLILGFAVAKGQCVSFGDYT